MQLALNLVSHYPELEHVNFFGQFLLIGLWRVDVIEKLELRQYKLWRVNDFAP